jgi:hypothetical protein
MTSDLFRLRQSDPDMIVRRNFSGEDEGSSGLYVMGVCGNRAKLVANPATAESFVG